jgi:hypothetical protein
VEIGRDRPAKNSYLGPQKASWPSRTVSASKPEMEVDPMRTTTTWRRGSASLLMLLALGIPSAFALACDRDEGPVEELREEADEAGEEVEDEFDEHF